MSQNAGVTGLPALDCSFNGNLSRDIASSSEKELLPIHLLFWHLYTPVATNCASFHAIVDRVAADQSVLIAYLDALARLANNRPPAYRANIAGNVTTLSGYAGISTHVEAASTAAQKILGSLADLATEGYRAKHITKLLETTDPAVQQLTTALKDVVTTDYTILLETKRTSLANYYEAPMVAQKGERLALILVQRQYDSDSASLVNRLALARAYGQVMTSVVATHATLAAEARSKASMKKLAEDIGPSLTNLKDAVAGLAATERR